VSAPVSTVDPSVQLGQGPATAGLRRKRRVLLDGFAVVVAGVFVLGLLNVPGVRTSTARGEAGGAEVEVSYGRVTRSGLETPLAITVTREGGFEEPVRLGVTAAYLGLFDENGLDPEPAASTTAGDLLLWEFDPPVGDRLDVSFDARISPAVQRGRGGAVVLFEGDVEVVRVPFHTTVLP
jgi:hypothetical protein